MSRARRSVGLVALIVVVVAAVLYLATRSGGEDDAPSAAAPAAGSARGPGGAPNARVASSVARQPSLTNGAVSGRVVSGATGEGIPGAHVTFAGEGSAALDGETDASGAFTLEATVPGRYVLAVASATGFLSYAPDWGSGAIAVVTRPGVHVTDVTLVLQPAIEYTAVVETGDGARVPGATVRLVDANQGEHAMAQLPDTFQSDAKGEVRFHAPDHTLLEAQHPAYGIGRARLDAWMSMSRRVVIRLVRRLEAAKPALESISGRVVDPAGAPVPTPLVRAAHLAPNGLHPRAEVRGDANGRFRLDGLDPGMHIVWVVCDGCASTRTRAMTGTEVTLTVGAGGTLVGRVVDATDGTPIPMFGIQVGRQRGAREIMLDETAVIDAEGRFEIRGLLAGDYQVRAAARGHAPSPPQPAKVLDASQPPQEVVIRLTRGGAIHGTVTDRITGAPIAGARVTVEGAGDAGGSVMPLAGTAVSDKAGAFTLAGVTPGLISIRAGAIDHHMAMLSGLRVEDGARLGPIDVKLSPTREGEQPRLELAGIGARLAIDDDALVIQELIPGGGAQLAGLGVGDGIVKVDGQRVAELGVRNAIERTRGPEGTRVVLAIRRAASGDALTDVTVERRAIRY